MRELAEELAKSLSIIYQQSWLTGEVPNDWKLANATPIYKKGCKEDPGNSRPVSLTSVPGEVMEQIILSAITRHLQDEQGIRPSQHGSRKGLQGIMVFESTPISLWRSLSTGEQSLIDFSSMSLVWIPHMDPNILTQAISALAFSDVGVLMDIGPQEDRSALQINPNSKCFLWGISKKLLTNELMF
ncbi:hypothetical protein BTVI_55900 [Pitangus sulphuratus]|nr:hypothetical protein BTVI_55900 [Pitangus sulphuratus]